MIEALYFIVILGATFLGACAGLGGGVIIKPVLDAIHAHDVFTISFLSTAAVFTMAVYSTWKQTTRKVQFDIVMLALVALGSIMGGQLGSYAFGYMAEGFDPSNVTALQSLMLSLLLLAVIFYVNSGIGGRKVRHKAAYAAIGLVLGALSSFLGIGGGPVNVAAFVFFFSVDIKMAAVYSIAVILFSQGAKLIFIALTTGFGRFDLTLLYFILPASVLGGIWGTFAQRKLSVAQIRGIFSVTVGLTLLLAMYNFIRSV